jgi:TolB protein
MEGATMKRLVCLGFVLAALAIMAVPAHASFPGANGRITFESYGQTPNRIGVAESDGAGVTFLTASNRRRDYEPSWSADGEMVVFDTLTANFDRPKIQTMAADGTDRTVVYEAPPRMKAIIRPVWSPDRSQIAFCAAIGRDFDLHILIMSADGSSLTNISGPDNRSDCLPDWSPDGTMIAFDSNGVWTMNTDGTGRQEVVDAGAWPSWSPDGTMIAYERGGRRQSDIFVVGADGSNVTRLTDTPKRFENTPAFSPDSTLVAFSRGASEFVFDDRDVFTVAPADLAVERITDSRRSEHAVAWQPLLP